MLLEHYHAGTGFHSAQGLFDILFHYISSNRVEILEVFLLSRIYNQRLEGNALLVVINLRISQSGKYKYAFELMGCCAGVRVHRHRSKKIHRSSGAFIFCLSRLYNGMSVI